ncbi:fumarylacetoacetate hydrolase family protein [Microvirga zambiensis]|uniref:fumarylacetoacetate hydrolase family protein n=1 Tax=Microvirga zambiensis TaxID=1402137 RepID=UPI00191DED1D|nr:fumarylacetoacetate hydrolase family protein [Microvirga zambiensis]
MKYVSFALSGQASWGYLEGENVVAVGLGDGAPVTLRDAIASGMDLSASSRQAPRLRLSEVELLPVIPNPGKIICVGLNYEDHRKESGRAQVGHPTLFARFANSQVGHNHPLVRPKESTEFDYEGELALVVSRRGRFIPSDEAFEYVAGYACYNDASIRDWQRHTSQFLPGKNFIATGAFGPSLVTPDDVGPLDDLRIRTRLNGEMVQESTLGHMIFDIPTIISYCSTFTELEPGDVIVTGTPGGVGMKRTPPLWMKDGDVVEVEIDRVGLLRNSVIDAR